MWGMMHQCDNVCQQGGRSEGAPEGRSPIENHWRFRMAIEAYCVKCKAKKEMVDPVESVTKNGKPITKGKCPDCGTTICRIGAAK